MLDKIISSGRMGSERAALDVALEMGISHGGCVPAEAAVELRPFVGLTQLSGVASVHCLERNVVDSDGTLMITFGRPEGDTDMARRFSLQHGRQLLHIDAALTETGAAAELIRSWIEIYRISVVHVTGVDAQDPNGLYAAAVPILVFAVEALRRKPARPAQEYPLAPHNRPVTLQQAVQRLATEMSLRDKALMANTEHDGIGSLFEPMIRSVIVRFGLSAGNELLIESCRSAGKQPEMGPEEAATTILRTLWKSLRGTHRIRIIK
jgi:hypothetical protein